MNHSLAFLLDRLRWMQERLRDHLHKQSHSGTDGFSRVAEEAASDTIYAIDRNVEDLLLEDLAAAGSKVSFLLIAEGISEEGPLPFPAGTDPEDCQYRVILDPIDGTRMIMYDKRSAWSLAGVAPNRGGATTLRDIEAAVMTEIPTSKQGFADTLWAVQGEGARGWRTNLLDGSRRSWQPAPSRAADLHHGFAQVTKFFMGRKALAAQVEEMVFQRMGVFEREERCLVFDDQYLSTGGQIYELLSGHDRFQADIRAALRRARNGGGPPPGMACHPYDLCTELIAREAGIILTGLQGEPVSCPLDTTSDVNWIAYANLGLHKRMAPILKDVFQELGLW